DGICDRHVRRLEADGQPDDLQGGWHLRDGELRTRLLPDTDEPARVARVPPGRTCERRSDRRDLQPVQRHQSEQLPRTRRRAGVGRLGSRAARTDNVLRRLPSSGTARRPGWSAVYVLVTGSWLLVAGSW